MSNLIIEKLLAKRKRTDLPDEVRVLEDDPLVGFSANANKGIAATGGEYVVIANPVASSWRVVHTPCVSRAALHIVPLHRSPYRKRPNSAATCVPR